MPETDLLSSNRQQFISTWDVPRNEPATVLLPTPPLADETAMTFSTPVIFRLWGRFAQVGGVPDRGRPCKCYEMILSSTRAEPYQRVFMIKRLQSLEAPRQC